MLTFFKELASYSYVGDTLAGIGDSDPFFTMGKLRLRNTQVIQQISEGNFYCPTLFSFHGDHDRFCFTCQTPLGARFTAAGTPNPATSRPPPGLEGPRRPKGKRPPIESGTGLGVGLLRWPRGALRTLPGLLLLATAAHPTWGLRGWRRRRRPGNTDSHSEPTCLPVRGAARPGQGSRPPTSLSGARGGGVATAAEHFRVRCNLRRPSGPSALPRPAGPRARGCPLVAVQGASQLLSDGLAARSLVGKQPCSRRTLSSIRRQG